MDRPRFGRRTRPLARGREASRTRPPQKGAAVNGPPPHCWPSCAPPSGSDPPQFRDASDFDPLDDEDVAVAVEAGAVWADELPRNERVARLRTQRIVPGRRVRITEVLDDLVRAVDQCNATV